MRIAAEFEIKRVGDKAVLTIASGEFEKLGKAAETAKPKISSLAGLIQGELNGSLQGMAGRAGSAGGILAGLGPAGLAAAAGLGAIVAAATSITAGLIAATKATISYADKIGTLQEMTDLSVKTLQALDGIARKSGTSVDTAAKAVANMQQAIVKGDPAFKSLGLHFAELRKLPPEEALVRVARAIDNIGDSAGRTAARRDVFGKMGDELGPLLSTLARGTGDVDRFGLALSDASIKGAKALGDEVTDLGTIWGQFTRQLGDTVVQTGLAQEGVEFLTGALGNLAQWVRDNKDDIAGFFKTIWNNADQAAEAILRAIPGIGAARAAVQAGSASRTWDETTMGVAPGQWVPGQPIPPPPPKPTSYISPEMQKRLDEETKRLAEEVRKSWQAVDDFRMATAQAAQKLNAAFYADLQRINQQGNLDPTRGPTGSYGQQLLAMYTSGLEKELPRGRQIGSTLLGNTIGGAGAATDTLARKAAVDWNQSLQNLAHTMQLLGGETNELTKALGVAIGGLAAAQQVAQIMGDRKFGQLKGSEKLAVGAAGLGVAAGAYQGGSVLGGAAGGAAFGAQFGGVGIVIGALAGGALGFFGKAAKERKELEALRGELTATHGSMDQIRKLGAAVGVSMDVAFSTKSPAAAKAAIEAFEKALAKTKGELTDWEKGIVSAQARALVLAQPGDKDVQGFVRGQREAGLGGLGAGIKGIKLATVEDARAQAAIVAVNFWDTFKTEGFVKAADAFKDIMATVQASLAKIGGDEAAAAILGPIQQLVDLGTVSEAFRGAAEGAQGLATNLDSLANRSIPLTASQFGAFGQQASSAFAQAQAAAIETGMSAAEAQNAAIMATAPLLQSLVQASQAYGFTLDEDTQRMLGMAEASGIAFKTDSTDRLILSINALTTSLGGIPPTFEAIGASAVTSSQTTAAATQGVVTTTAEGVFALAEVATGASTTMTDVLTAGTLQATGTISQVWGATTTGVMSDFTATTMQMEDVWKGTEGMMVTSFIETLPSAIEVYLQELDRIPTEIITNAKFSGTVPEGPGHAAGVVNAYYGARPGGRWLNVAEGGRGEYVTVTHRPVTLGLGGVGITGLRVPRGVTHAQEGLWNITDVLAPWGGGSIVDAIGGGGGGALVNALAAWGGGGSEQILDQVLAGQQQIAQNIAGMTSAVQAMAESGGAAQFNSSVNVQVGELRVSSQDEMGEFEENTARAVRRGNGPFIRALEAKYGKALTGRR